MDTLDPIYLDDAMVVLDKPSGLLSVPGRGEDKQDSLSTRVRLKWPDAMVVHRLDMATSGLMVFARGAHAQRSLNRAFAERLVLKRYVAVVGGIVAPVLKDGEAWGTIDLPLILDWPRRPLSIVDHQNGKPSLTRWRVLAHEAQATRVELEPVTGRSHQLRVHMQALGHAILGDTLYATLPRQRQAHRLMLHARLLMLPHPMNAHVMTFCSRVPF